MFNKYDLIVVGAGHAGCEAAAIAATMGAKTLLITMNLQMIGQMSCNPAMGGVAKGQIIKEIDALGGFSGIISDKSMIQFRLLNKSKGPAMWSPRTQNDKMLFATLWRQQLESLPNLDLFQDMVAELILADHKVVGIKTALGISIFSNRVVLTNGTFLNGIIHIGEKQMKGGRVGEGAAKGITEQLISLGFESGRMKTGTPPRVDSRSLDFSKMEVQEGDKFIEGFSFMNIPKPSSQKCCWITYTNEIVHEELAKGFDRSPMYAGRIEGIGPRYCPSIEDKIIRFADKNRHQIFVEPEGWNTNEIYVNGFSTSLPEDVQFNAISKMQGFEHVKFLKPGYAIEYDYFPPTQLKRSLETKEIGGLYFAGQINGTTGYEEAAGQGLVAGINAVLSIQDKEPLVLKREESYIGVLIDDLINKGTNEPYRMFTSRAEYRILLRGDNADFRLTPIGDKLGTVSKERIERMQKRKNNVENIIHTFESLKAKPEDINPLLEQNNTATLKQQFPLINILNRPEISIDILVKDKLYKDYFDSYELSELVSAEIEMKYGGYIKKEHELAQKSIDLENLIIPASFDYKKINSLSIEAREKLEKIRPTSIGQAKRISGINPSDISVLLIFIGR